MEKEEKGNRAAAEKDRQILEVQVIFHVPTEY
jgi:hypothetical protein